MEADDVGIWRRRSPHSEADRLVVVGGMHGDEQMGAAVVQELQDRAHALWREADDVHVDVIVGNPAALGTQTRSSSSGRDLNRMFGPDPPQAGEDFEYQRSVRLRAIVEGATRLLDLHQTHCETPPLAVVTNTPLHLEMVARLGLEIAVVGTDVVYGPCMIADLVNRHGGVGITVETGRADSSEALAVGREVARRFLTLESNPLESLRPVWVLELVEAVECPGAGLRFRRELGNTSRLEAGEVWADWEGGELRAPRDVVVFLPREGAPPGRSCALFAEDRGLFQPGVSR
jgi:predicted deacylase